MQNFWTRKDGMTNLNVFIYIKINLKNEELLQPIDVNKISNYILKSKNIFTTATII